jgi:hypothetical protein
MKTYNQFINEMSAFLLGLMQIEKKYPGVLPFLSVATRFINKPGKIKDPELRKVLRKLQGDSDVGLYTPAKMKMIQNYVKTHNLERIEDVRNLFYPDGVEEGDDEQQICYLYK